MKIEIDTREFEHEHGLRAGRAAVVAILSLLPRPEAELAVDEWHGAMTARELAEGGAGDPPFAAEPAEPAEPYQLTPEDERTIERLLSLPLGLPEEGAAVEHRDDPAPPLDFDRPGPPESGRSGKAMVEEELAGGEVDDLTDEALDRACDEAAAKPEPFGLPPQDTERPEEPQAEQADPPTTASYTKFSFAGRKYAARHRGPGTATRYALELIGAVDAAGFGDLAAKIANLRGILVELGRDDLVRQLDEAWSGASRRLDGAEAAAETPARVSTEQAEAPTGQAAEPAPPAQPNGHAEEVPLREFLRQAADKLGRKPVFAMLSGIGVTKVEELSPEQAARLRADVAYALERVA